MKKKKIQKITVPLTQDYFDKKFSQSDKKFRRLIQNMNKGFKEHNKKFEEHDKKFEEHDKRFDRIDKKLEEHDKKFDKIDKKLEEHDKKFDRIDKKLEEHDKKFDKIDKKLDKHDKKISDIKTGLFSVRYDLKEMSLVVNEIKEKQDEMLSLLDGYVKSNEDFKDEFYITKAEVEEIKKVIKKKLGVKISLV